MDGLYPKPILYGRHATKIVGVDGGRPRELEQFSKHFTVAACLNG